MKKEIYYDNSATTRVDDRVLAAMLPYYSDYYGNSSSIHTLGQTALNAVDESRDIIADYLDAEIEEVIFTSGATESNNLAILGVVNYWRERKSDLHVITTKIEHPSVLEVYRYLEKKGLAKVSYLDVDANGIVKLDQLKKIIKSNTVLVSVMYANNEVGAIQPIREISELIKAARVNRDKNDLPLYLHVDAVQAFNYLDCRVDELGIDFLSFSGHKIYGPKGIGGLYARAGVKFQQTSFGGHQEYNVRPGTLNVPAIVGLGKSVALVKEDKEKNIYKIKKIKEKLLKDLSKIANIKFNCDTEYQLPNIINVSFKKAEGESILMMLDMDSIAISTGSACSSGSLEPSPILTAMGVPPEWSHGSVRISLGKNNSEMEVPVFIKSLSSIIKKLRDMAP